MTAHLKDISSFIAMEVLARAQELEANGRDIIHLEVGEPDFQAPSEALETVINSLSKKPARYTHTQGILSLREEIAKKYKEIMEWKSIQARFWFQADPHWLFTLQSGY